MSHCITVLEIQIVIDFLQAVSQWFIISLLICDLVNLIDATQRYMYGLSDVALRSCFNSHEDIWKVP